MKIATKIVNVKFGIKAIVIEENNIDMKITSIK